jgi:hypothetical protein
MVKDPQLYRVMSSVDLADIGHVAYCEHCKNPVYDRAVYGADPALRQQARRGWVVLTERMYRVVGPDGERQVCQQCIKRCRFRWQDEDGSYWDGAEGSDSPLSSP